jgi:peptidoglycan/xylan/chitin deacetylase (PgdA/CDA1 family)
MAGIFSISLDFELHWGRFDKVSLDATAKNYFLQTRSVLPQMVKLFAENEIHVTWAIVGMLYNRNAAEWRQHQPSVYPAYQNKNYSSYEWVQQNGLTEPDDPFHFAPEFIRLIEEQPNFEIGTHTYSHYYCKEQGQTLESFRADLQLAIEVAGKRGHQLKSLVFPRNQFNHEYLQVCTELGIETVRSNPSVWYWDANRPESLAKKIFRTGDAYIPLPPSKVVPLQQLKFNTNPLLLPASRLYRAWSSKSNLLNRFKLNRILNEMSLAARQQAYYHLWWHPHNFGFHPNECMQELNLILNHYQQLKKQYGFQSFTMLETKNFLRQQF